MAKTSAVVRLTVFTVLAAAPTLCAQDVQTLAPGARVRVTAESKLVGKLVTMNAESLVVQVADHTRLVPRSTVRRFEVSARPSRKKKGIVIGACVSGGLGMLLGLAGAAFCDGGGCVVGSAILGAVLGALPGAAIGAAVAPGDKWVEVPIDRARLSLGPARRGAGVGLTLSF